MLSCRFCGAELFDEDDICPDCGKRVSRRGRRDADDPDDDSDRRDYRRKQPSSACTASLVLGIIGVVGYAVVFGCAIFLAANAAANGQNAQKPPQNVEMALGCAAMSVALLNVIGTILGAIGLAHKPSNKTIGTVGLVLNILQVLLFAVLFVVGLAIQGGAGGGGG